MLWLVLPAFGREQRIIQKKASAPVDAQARAADTWLDQTPGNTTTTHGSDTTLQVRSLNNQNQRAIVQFDLSPIPSAGIKSATLTLHVVTPPASTLTYNAHRVTSFLFESGASWANRLAGTPWGTAGGDFTGGATSSASVTNVSTSVSWNITADVQAWYNGTANYGTVIRDNTENAGASVSTVFSSKEDATDANHPQLSVTFVQNVINLTATPGNATVTLNWGYPAAIGTVLEANNGVVILRRTSAPVDKAAAPTDGVVPALGAALSTGCVVFVDNTSATSFVDSGANCGAVANGATYYYKVFTRDSANNYSTTGTTNPSTFDREISATPSATTTQNSHWMASTVSVTLAPPALIPNQIALTGAGNNLMFGVNPSNGQPSFPFALGGVISGRAPIIPAASSSLARDVTYVAAQDGLVYAVDINTGQIVWVVNPTGLTTNGFQGGAAVQIKSFNIISYTRPTDLVVVGTRNAGTTTANVIAGIDGNTGATAWQMIGGGANPALDIVSSTPLVDYNHGAVWVTSRSAGGAGQPSLWKINPNTGAIITTAALGPTDSSPSLSDPSDVLFVGNNAGTLFAIDPTTTPPTTLASFTTAQGTAIVGFPAVVGAASPYTVVIANATTVQGITFNKGAGTFTLAWTTPITTPSVPLALTGLATVYVGSGDGRIHQLTLATGVDAKQRIVNTGQPGIVGDPAIDVVLSQIYVSTTDQRIYAFTFPF